ncbi:MAG: bifunctional oligoribonuclease/PAP phosphatase NrnA [Peptococcaceae bacterium]|nr:bifunctional oligoribonuclease/PAP phosphatase NrnA [Peptococcaceae bacterium]
MNSLASIAGAMAGVSSVLVTGHVMPDGDSIGSTLALKLALESVGKQVTAAGPDPVPEMYRFLPGALDYRVLDKVEGRYDAFVALDCSVPDRLGEGFREMLHKTAVVVNLDHHVGTGGLGTHNYIDNRAAATGEIVFDLLEEMKIPLTADIACCLYVAVATDTGSFQYESTSPGTHRRVARMIQAGVPVAEVSTRLYEEKSFVSLKVLSASLATLALSDCGRIAWMTLPLEIMEKFGATDEHAEGVVNYARSVSGVEIGLFFREIAPGKYKISFRSKGNVDVNRVAALFGGGGHRRAAGCVVEGSLAELQARVVEAARRSLRGS